MIVSLSWYRKPFVAFVAAKKFLRFRATPNSTKTRSNFTFDPATGALVITPNLDLVIRKALMRVRRIKFRLFLRRRFLQVEYLTLQARSSALHAIGYFLSILTESFFKHKKNS